MTYFGNPPPPKLEVERPEASSESHFLSRNDSLMGIDFWRGG